MKKTSHKRIRQFLNFIAVAIAMFASQCLVHQALAQDVQVAQLGQPTPPSRQAELMKFVGSPTGEDIAIMAVDFTWSILPGVPAAEMTSLYNDVRDGEASESALGPLMLAVRQGNAAAIKRAVEQIAKADSKEASVQFVGGLWAEAKRGDSARAVEWFSRARDLVEDEADKLLVDRYILGSALLANSEGESVRQAGVEAANRLSGSFWNVGSGTARALAEALVDFGEPEAASEVTAQAKSSASPAASTTARRSRANYQEVVNLLAVGDREEALNLAVDGVRLAVASFAQSGSLDSISYTYRQMVQFVAAYGLSDAVLERMNVVEGSNQDRANFAIAAEMLNKLDIAIPMYRKLVADDPEQHAARWRLVMNSVGTPVAKDLLEEFPPAQLQQFGSSLANLLQMEQDFFRRLEVVELIQSFLDSIEPDASGNLSWVANVLSPLAESFYSDDVRILGVHQPEGSYGYDNETQRLRSEAAAERRSKLHGDVCESMLRHPTLAAQAFASISGFGGMAGHRTEAEFTQLARELIESTASPDESFYYTHPTSTSSLPRLTPAQFLFRQAVDVGSMAVIDGEIVPLAEKAGKTNLAASMKAFSKLFSCDPEDYVETATNIAESGAGGVTADSWINFAQSTAQQRQLDADLGPLVLSTIRKVRDTSSNVPYSARNYASSIYRSRGPGVAREFIDGVAEIYLGPVEGQREFVTKHFKVGYRSGEPSGLTYAFKEFLERLSSPMGLTVLATEKFIKCGYEPVADNDMASRFRNSVRSYRFDDDYDATYGMLDDSPWLKPVAEFSVWPMRHLSQRSCYGHLIQQMKQSSSSVRSRMLSHIRSVKPETFGKNLTLACFEEPMMVGVSRVIATHLRKIKALPVERQKELAAWYEQVGSEQGGGSLVTSYTRAVRSWIAEVNAPPKTASATSDRGNGQRSKGTAGGTESGAVSPSPARVAVSSIAQAFLDAKSPTDVSTSIPLHQHVLPILVTSVENPDLCARIFAHYKALAALPQQVRSGGSQGEDSVESELLASFITQVDPRRSAKGRSFAPLVAIFSSEAGRLVMPGQALSSALASTFAGGRSDVSPGVRAVLSEQATPERDLAAALLLAGGIENRSESVYGMRMARLSDLAVSNGWAATGGVLAADNPSVVSNLVNRDSAPIGLRLLAAGSGLEGSFESRTVVAKLAVAAFDEGASLPATVMLPFLEVYLSLGEQQGGGEWKTTARRFLHCLVQSLNPSGITAERFIGLMEAAGKTGYSGRRVMLRFGQGFTQQPWMMAMLVKHGQFAEARKLLRSRLGQMQLPQVPAARGAGLELPTGNVVSRSISTRSDGTRRITEGYDDGREITFIEDQFGNRTVEGTAGAGGGGPVTFDDELGAAIPEFVKTLKDPGLGALAELILLAAPDPSPETKSRNLGRGVRIRQEPEPTEAAEEESGVRRRVMNAAARIAGIKIDNPFIEERVLSILAPIAVDSEPLRARIAAYGRSVDVVALAMFEDEAIKQPRQRIFKAHLDAALVHRPEDFAAIMETLLASKKSRDYRVTRALQFYGSSFPDVLFHSAAGFNMEKAGAYIPVFRRLLEAGGMNSEWRKRHDCLNAAIVCHVLAGKTAEFTDWFASLDESLRSNVSVAGAIEAAAATGDQASQFGHHFR